MKEFVTKILEWGEVWALFIPLIILIVKKRTSFQLLPIVIYLLFALIINFTEDFIQKYGIKLSFTNQPGDNGFIYNTHSIVRFALFGWFFIRLKQPLYKFIQKVIPVFFIAFILVNFTVYENYFSFSSHTFAFESLLLLVYCFLFYLNYLNHSQNVSYKGSSFWVVTGLSIYVVIDFPIFLFFTTLSLKVKHFAISIWNVQNIVYIILCCFFAKAFLNQDHE